MYPVGVIGTATLQTIFVEISTLLTQIRLMYFFCFLNFVEETPNYMDLHSLL